MDFQVLIQNFNIQDKKKLKSNKKDHHPQLIIQQSNGKEKNSKQK